MLVVPVDWRTNGKSLKVLTRSTCITAGIDVSIPRVRAFRVTRNEQSVRPNPNVDSSNIRARRNIVTAVLMVGGAVKGFIGWYPYTAASISQSEGDKMF